MTSRPSVRLVLPILLSCLALAACGGDEDPDPTGAAEASAPATTSAAEPTEPEPSGGTELSGDGVAACAELEAIVTDITSEYPDGVGLSTDAVPGEQQVAALTQLVTSYGAAEVADEQLAALRDSVVAAAQTILGRAEAAEPVTEADTTAFTSAFADLGIVCESAR